MRGDGSWVWLFAVPAFALMALISAVPIAQTLWLSGEFHRLGSDARLLNALKNTFLFTLFSVAAEFTLGLGMALILARRFPGRGLVRAIVLIPWALPAAVMAMAWTWILHADYGVLGDALYRAGLSSTPKIPWLASSNLAFFSCILADAWKTAPFMALILLGGLAAIPEELYEAAAMDGAGPWEQFKMVTWPMLKPAAAIAVVFRAIQAFGIFDLIWVMTGGGPGGSTQTIALYIYDTVFRYQELAYGCTLTLVMAACLCLLTAGLWLLVRGKEVSG